MARPSGAHREARALLRTREGPRSRLSARPVVVPLVPHSARTGHEAQTTADDVPPSPSGPRGPVPPEGGARDARHRRRRPGSWHANSIGRGRSWEQSSPPVRGPGTRAGAGGRSAAPPPGRREPTPGPAVERASSACHRSTPPPGASADDGPVPSSSYPAVVPRVVRASLALGVAAALGTGLVGPAPADPDPGRAGAARYRPPLDEPVQVLRGFDPPPRPWLAGHRGVDLTTAPGATVRAPAGGVVTFAGAVAGRGVVSVLHDDGRRSSLEPVGGPVPAGTRVVAGDPLGTVDGPVHDGTLAVPALHWGVREGDTYVDPWALLPGRGPVVLLPVS
ncbi:peptidoglycan DD-metalloendopeptidase family protein [Cellulomonas sp. zg-ZUI40]|nr:peptidoglycan DD-metalloendopeptidase family protein [Cellulomonas dongxiuzhuiae]